MFHHPKADSLAPADGRPVQKVEVERIEISAEPAMVVNCMMEPEELVDLFGTLELADVGKQESVEKKDFAGNSFELLVAARTKRSAV